MHRALVPRPCSAPALPGDLVVSREYRVRQRARDGERRPKVRDAARNAGRWAADRRDVLAALVALVQEALCQRVAPFEP